MTTIKVDDRTFRREINGILRRIKTVGESFHKITVSFEKRDNEIDEIVKTRGTSEAFGKQKKLVGELIATLDRVDSTIDYIKDSVLLMQEEVDRSEKADDE